MANVKNESTAYGLNVNCLTADGALNKYMAVNIGLGGKTSVRDVLRATEFADRKTDLPKVTIDTSKIHIEGLECKTPHGAVKEVKASAIIPPKFLNASKNSTHSREEAVFGRNR